MIPKYYYVASLKEIKTENNYNLNIPRYVDTYEEEALIDLEQTSSEIFAIDKLIDETDKLMNEYVKELSITSPVKLGKVR